MAKTKNFEAVIRAKLAEDLELAAAVEGETFNANIAIQVYAARTAIGLTQAELAKRAGTLQSVISRIEDADYTGHSLALLKRIALALGTTLDVHFGSPTPAVKKTPHRGKVRVKVN
jgi:ribosome-binding protein aMBF1 (putative translation factor)